MVRLEQRIESYQTSIKQVQGEISQHEQLNQKDKEQLRKLQETPGKHRAEIKKLEHEIHKRERSIEKLQSTEKKYTGFVEGYKKRLDEHQTALQKMQTSMPSKQTASSQAPTESQQAQVAGLSSAVPSAAATTASQPAVVAGGTVAGLIAGSSPESPAKEPGQAKKELQEQTKKAEPDLKKQQQQAKDDAQKAEQAAKDAKAKAEKEVAERAKAESERKGTDTQTAKVNTEGKEVTSLADMTVNPTTERVIGQVYGGKNIWTVESPPVYPDQMLVVDNKVRDDKARAEVMKAAEEVRRTLGDLLEAQQHLKEVQPTSPGQQTQPTRIMTEAETGLEQVKKEYDAAQQRLSSLGGRLVNGTQSLDLADIRANPGNYELWGGTYTLKTGATQPQSTSTTSSSQPSTGGTASVGSQQATAAGTTSSSTASGQTTAGGTGSGTSTGTGSSSTTSGQATGGSTGTGASGPAAGGGTGTGTSGTGPSVAAPVIVAKPTPPPSTGSTSAAAGTSGDPIAFLATRETQIDNYVADARFKEALALAKVYNAKYDMDVAKQSLDYEKELLSKGVSNPKNVEDRQNIYQEKLNGYQGYEKLYKEAQGKRMSEESSAAGEKQRIASQRNNLLEQLTTSVQTKVTEAFNPVLSEEQKQKQLQDAIVKEQLIQGEVRLAKQSIITALNHGQKQDSAVVKEVLDTTSKLMLTHEIDKYVSLHPDKAKDVSSDLVKIIGDFLKDKVKVTIKEGGGVNLVTAIDTSPALVPAAWEITNFVASNEGKRPMELLDAAMLVHKLNDKVKGELTKVTRDGLKGKVPDWALDVASKTLVNWAVDIGDAMRKASEAESGSKATAAGQ